MTASPSTDPRPASGSAQPTLRPTTPSPAPATTTLHRPAGLAAALGGVLLLAVFVVALPPDPANSLAGAWVPTQAGHCVALLLMILGLPAIAASLPRLGVTGLVGYVALQTQLVFSFGSHVYLMWVVPILERHRAALGAQIEGDRSPLHKYYTTHDAALGLVLGLGMTGLAIALWRAGRGMRTIAAIYTVGLVGEFLQLGPVGLGPVAVVVAWLGARLWLRGSALAPLRARPAAAGA